MKLGCSPITGTVYAGSTRVDKHGLETWSKKEDVTNDAVAVVAESLLIRDIKFCFNLKGKSYTMEVKEDSGL